MFLFILKYKKDLDEVNKYLEAHRTYLDVNYKIGNFIASGRQEPRIGGVIICRAENKEVAEMLVQQDPFYIHEIADYQIVQFEPTKYVEGFDKFL